MNSAAKPDGKILIGQGYLDFSKNFNWVSTNFSSYQRGLRIEETSA